ncbi:MAG: TIGR02646 family protein [Alphaproteobacteria bacterium]|nr:TIGR02646 family protein [Alphaproteobacteria bacterium]
MKPVIPLPRLPEAARVHAESIPELRGPDAWRSLRDNCRDGYDALRERLRQNQRGLCAYPSGAVVEVPDQEVEHFHPKSRDEDGRRWVFEPGNLFVTCRNTANGSILDDPHRVAPPASCGTFKAERNPDDAIESMRPLKPSELPHAEKVFRVGQRDGALSPCPSGCGAAGLASGRVQATIDFLNLDCRRLRQARTDIIPELAEMLLLYLGTDADDSLARQHMAEDALLAGKDGDLPTFFSTIREFLQPEAEDVLAEKRDKWLEPAS